MSIPDVSNEENVYKDFPERFPNLYSNGMYFECGPGWRKIIEDLSTKLEKLIVEMKVINPFPLCYAVQVKEKFGTLRFYMNSCTDEMDRLIEEAEALSAKTCEVCGNEGHIRPGKWIQTLCERHA